MRSSSSDFASQPPAIPDHEMIRQIGKGSYGEVWLGRSVTGALRAVKVVSRADFEHDRTFEREFEGIKSFEPISRKHPGLVNILHVGRNDGEGFYYYVMELGDDRLSGREIVPELYVPRTLSSDIKEKAQLPMDACASWGAVMADALEHMHQRGLAHRDVKPSNVIFVDGVPKLADIGLVAASGQRTFVGTEGFVPPEGPGESSADIYSLGMVLYEMSTGNDRLEFPSIPQLVGDETERKKWRRMNSIVCKACAPSPKGRYASARDMRIALQSLSTGIQPPAPFSTKVFRVAVFSGLLAAGIVGLRNHDLFGAYVAGRQIAYTDLGAIETPPPDPADGVGGTTPDPPEVIDVPPPDPDPPKARFGSIKISTVPSGAEVFQIDTKGERIKKGETAPDYFETEVEPGEVAFELILEGYRTMPVHGFVVAGETLPLGGKLEFFRPPVEGQAWENSRGINFAYIDDRHVAARPFLPEEFDEFHKTRAEPIDFHRVELVPGGVPEAVPLWTVMVNRQVAGAYCDWLTAEEQARGFLGDDQYYTLDEEVAYEVRDLEYGKNRLEQRFALFTSVRRADFATLNIDSAPRGAGVYIADEYRGRTPVELERMRPGAVVIRLRMAGYRQEVRLLEVKPGEGHEVSVKLRESAGVVFGKTWKNGLGMKMLPLEDGVMMAAWETRVKDFDAFVAATKREPTHRPTFPQEPDHPAVHVNHDDAVEFCAWLTNLERAEGLIEPQQSYRLPTDREWSLAAGLESEAGDSPAARDRPIKGVFPWGKEWPPAKGTVNLADSTARNWLPPKRIIAGVNDGYSRTSPVGKFAPNAMGFFDLAGNVWEWVAEPYGGGSSFKEWAVARGGGYDSSLEEHFLSSYRNVQPPEERGTIHGFRVVLAEDQVE